MDETKILPVAVEFKAIETLNLCRHFVYHHSKIMSQSGMLYEVKQRRTAMAIRLVTSTDTLTTVRSMAYVTSDCKLTQ